MSKSFKKVRINFSPDLVSLVLNKEKFLTWRINDDKDIQVGDELILWLKGKNHKGQKVEALKEFGKASVVDVWEKRFKDFGEKEKNGHEKFLNDQEMINQYKKYYGSWVSENTIVKIIHFKLIS